MMKHHRIQIAIITDRNQLYELVVPISGAEDAWRKGHDGRFYVHPDSLPLLAPQDCDRDIDGYSFCAKTQAWWREDGCTHGQRTLHAKLPEESRPARRNDLPFIQPESEARMSTEIKARPILFSPAMVRALLNATNSQTRRIITPPPFKVESGLRIQPSGARRHRVHVHTGCVTLWRSRRSSLGKRGMADLD